MNNEQLHVKKINTLCFRGILLFHKFVKADIPFPLTIVHNEFVKFGKSSGVKFGIIDVNKYSSGQWKKLVEKNIIEKNKTDLLETVKGKYKKISYEELSTEKFELKPYMRQLNISLARDKFRLRSKMTRTVKFNFPSDKKFRADMWRCWHCPSIDSQAHVRVCPAYQEFRLNKDLDNDKDLVLYFRQVIKLRDDMPSDE